MGNGVLFNSLTFLFFFAVVFSLHFLARGWGMRKNVLLLASYVFYAAWDPPYVAILIASTLLDWWLARRIDRTDAPRRRRFWLVLSLVGNLGLLGYFKYGGFLLLNTQLLAGAFGLHYQPPAWNIVLPIGISFYTFASLSYTIDVYRRDIRADASLRDYALFVGFFPHLVAGPIVRASLLLPQFQTPRAATSRQIGWGLVLVILGLFGKTVLADAVFAPIADEVYADPSLYGAAAAWSAVFAFSGQIYFDFSAYSLCAIGLALCFGFEFPDNFRSPYAAVGMADFWRRWHISLSTWLRDYLYIPLGGNRFGERRTQINLWLTMLLGGLWHGASWLFVVWGALHGAYLAIGRRLGRPAQALESNAIGRVALMVSTFFLVTLTWIPFRAHSIANAASLLQAMVRFDGGVALDSLQSTSLLLVGGGMLTWQILLRDSSLEQLAAITPGWLKFSWILACLVGLFLFSGGDERAFIYFQF
jgi:alginate O-acetyltransferase complex protein AlgI